MNSIRSVYVQFNGFVVLKWWCSKFDSDVLITRYPCQDWVLRYTSGWVSSWWRCSLIGDVSCYLNVTYISFGSSKKQEVLIHSIQNWLHQILDFARLVGYWSLLRGVKSPKYQKSLLNSIHLAAVCSPMSGRFQYRGSSILSCILWLVYTQWKLLLLQRIVYWYSLVTGNFWSIHWWWCFTGGRC